MNTMNAGFLSGPELVVVFLVILVLFGAKKIPEFAKGLGQGIKEFKKASREVTDEINNGMNSPPPPPSSGAPADPSARPQSASPNPPSTVPKA